MNTDLTFEYPHPPTSEEAISAFEKELGYRLPEDYRQFLLKCNGGGRPNRPDFDYGYSNGEIQQSAVEEFFGLDTENKHSDIRIHQSVQDQPDYLLLIGHDLGNLLGIGIKGTRMGKVYVWEHTRQGDVILLLTNFLICSVILKAER